jgi:Carboxypeptidase regulatory-like domain
MRCAAALALVCALSVSVPIGAAPRLGGFGQAGASLSGTATSSSGQTVANATVRLRNLATGQLAGTTTSNAAGAFGFTGLQAGNYVVEVVNAAGQIIGTSASIGVAAGATITGVTVTASAAMIGGAAGAAGVPAGGISTAVVITSVAVAAGVAGAVAVATSGTASPSR